MSGSAVATLKRRLLSGGVWAGVGQGIALLSNLVVSAVLARLLSPAEMGAYFLITAVVFAASIAAQAGLGQTAIHLVARARASGDDAGARAALQTVFAIGCAAIGVVGLALVACGSWLAYGLFHSELVAGAINLSAGWLVVMSLQALTREALRGLHDLRAASMIATAVPSLATAGVICAAWLIGADIGLRGALLLVIAATGVCLAGGLVVLAARTRELPAGGSSSMSSVLSVAGPLMIANIAVYILYGVDMWVVGAKLTDHDAALYGCALRLATVVALPLNLVNLVLPPFIAELHTQGERLRLQKILRTAALLTSVPSAVALLLLAMFAEPILGLVYGDYYQAAATVLLIAAGGNAVNVFAGSCGFVLIMSGHGREMMVINLISGGLALVGALWGAAKYGTTGVAISFAAALAFQNVMTVAAVRHRVGVWTYALVRPRDVIDAVRGLVRG